MLLFDTSMHLVASYMFFVIVILLGFHFNYVVMRWKEDISGQRVKRTHRNSPSNRQRPSITRVDDVEARITTKSRKHDKFFIWKLLAYVEGKRKWKDNGIVQEKSKAIPFMGALETNEVAEELNMDHVFIGFTDFLWGYTFIGLMTYTLYLTGIIRLLARKYLVNKGILKLQDPDIDAVVGSMCLEQSQVIQYFAKTKRGSSLGNIAAFVFPDFPYVDNNCNPCVADLFAVDIDLDTKRFVKAKMDDIELTASETFILLCFNTIGAQHVKIHAMANWAINDHQSLRKTNPFLQQNSIATAMYNYFGYTGFPKFFKTWERWGLVSDGWRKNKAIIKCFDYSLKQGVGPHQNITELIPYSRFVNFSVKVRAIFFNEFAKQKHLFPGIDGEALFVGTVVHSLDHTFLEWNVADPLWLDVKDKKFGKMAEICRIVRAGFTEDLPFLYFNKSFKGSNQIFYQRVYQKAALIDKELADHMDTCIVK